MDRTNEMFTQPIQTWARFFMKSSQMFWSAGQLLAANAARTVPALGMSVWTRTLAPTQATSQPARHGPAPAPKPALKAVLEFKRPVRKGAVAGKRAKAHKK